MRRFAALCCGVLLVAGSAAGARATAPPGYYQDQKVVYHNDGGAPNDSAYFDHMLANLRNHVAAVGKDHVQIRVVDVGDGIDLLQQAASDPAVAHRIDALRAEGVAFLVCKNTIDARHVNWHTLYGVSEEDVVPSGVAEIARLEGMGFVYIHP